MSAVGTLRRCRALLTSQSRSIRSITSLLSESSSPDSDRRGRGQVGTLQKNGLPSNQVEAISAEVVNDGLPENVSQSFAPLRDMRQSFAPLRDMRKNEMTQYFNLPQFNYEIQSSQELDYSSFLRKTLLRRTEMLGVELKKMLIEEQREKEKLLLDIKNFRYNIDKSTHALSAKLKNFDIKFWVCAPIVSIYIVLGLVLFYILS